MNNVRKIIEFVVLCKNQLNGLKFLTKHIILLLTCLSLFGVGQTYATHLVGGYMSYEFLRTEADGDKTFKISLTLFRDVEQSNVDFDDEIKIGIYLNDAERQRNQIVTANILYRQLVKPPGSEECDYYSDKKIQMGYYERTVRLAPYPQGYHVYFVRCCRNIQNNLTLGSNGEPDQGQTYYCFIPNPAIENSSPFFSGVPSPYMCNNDTNTFLNRAIDPDGDSLVYRMVRPYQGGDIGQNASKPDPPTKLALPIDTVNYKVGYHNLIPFGAGGVSTVNAENGLTTLLSREVGSFVIAIEVEEYRNGILLSRVRLDMQILVLDCPPNKKPIASNDGGKYFEIEAGEKLCFKVRARDTDTNPPQSVTVYGSGDILTGENGVSPPLATMLTRKALQNVETEFCWTPSCEQARDKPYLVTISAQDDGCPPKYDNYNIQIKVNKFKGSDEIFGPKKVCATSSYEYIFDAVGARSTSSFWWSIDKGSIIGDADKENVTITFNGSGDATIRMVEISQYGCPGDTVDYIVELIPSPQTPIIAGKDTVCLGETNVSYTTAPTSGSTYKWFLPDGTVDPSTTANLDHSWLQLGDFVLSIVETNAEGCRSDTGRFDVNVRKPEPGLVGPLSVCPNAQGVKYSALGSGGSSYNWTIAGGIQASGSNSKDITVNWGNEGLGSITITETDKWGCVSDAIGIPVDKTYNLKGFKPVGDTSVCEFDANVPYSVVESNGSAYKWFLSGGNQIAGDSSSNILVTWGATGVGEVAVQQTAFDAVNSKACLSPILRLSVVINPIPTADEIEGDFDFCQGDLERTYTVNGFSGSSYVWEINGSAVGVKGQGSNQIQVTWPDPGTFTMSVIELSKDSCPGERIDTIVIVHPKPIADSLQGPFIRCFPDVNQTHYSISGYTNSTYSWNVTNGSFLPSTSDSIIVDWNATGYGSVAVVETSEFGCVGDTVQLPVYINNIELDLDRITIGFPDDRIHGEWQLLNDDLTGSPFIVEKRSYGVEVVWNTVAQEYYTNFTETDINADLNPFEVQVKTTDLCGNEVYSEIHRSILLEGVQNPNDFSLELNFSQYVGWDNGVDFYDLYRSKNEDRSLSLLQRVTFGENASIKIPGNSEDYRQCFRIKATELGGQNKTSWSNEICFFFNPNVYVPTAFSPNRDGLNEVFHPVSVAVKDYQLTIFNRWGEQIFITDDKDKGWDGTYNSANVQSGIYMYLVNFSDSEGKTYQKAGTVQLMR
ncbi:MAG: gliding motility-associated-like protein [Bacteroidia bacterium]|jgi:gliding motility-associated-like protein